MKKECISVLLVLLLLVGTASANYAEIRGEKSLSYSNDDIYSYSNEDLTKYVNPFIGTGIYQNVDTGAGNCYPGAVVPFGMVQLSPDTGKNMGGYLYRDNNIEGFSHTHLSGCGCFGFGNILTMPTIGDVETIESEYKSSFNHDSEDATPGYYSVLLDDYNIKAELTATTRCGLHRYTFPSASNAHILIDVTHTLEQDIPIPIDAQVKIIDDKTIKGYVTIPEPFCGGHTPYTTYFAAEFSKPFSSYGTWNNKNLYPGSKSQSGCDIGAYVNYSTLANEIIQVKVGISYVSEDQAYLNLETEIPNWDFDKIKNNAKEAWNDLLHRIEVEGGANDQKVIFYTALYHSFLMPHIFSDVNGRYIGFDDEIHVAENYTEYAAFSLWDTFRAEHPLLVLVRPDKQNDMIKSLIDQYEYGGWFPKWSFVNRYTNCMIADHATSVIVDSYLKGVNNFNISKAYEGMRKSAMMLPPSSHGYEGRNELDYYLNLGYVPYSKIHYPEDFILESVSKTLEYAYDDWCLAQMAKALGKDEDYNLFMERSMYYKNVFDPFTKFMRPKYINGWWKLFFIPGLWDVFSFTEGNSWAYTWFVPHDVNGLINLMGEYRFIRRLDYFFNKFAQPSWSGPWLFSHYWYGYWHGNEPAHHAPYLYNYAGKPWKTQNIVRRIMDKLYGTGPDGLSGNDDCGQLSSWFVFSAMGFYPVCPGEPTYQIGSPIFDKVTIHLNERYYSGNEFVILANNVSKENKYIQSVTLNGESLDRTWIKHSEIVNGGTMVFEMGNSPSNWGS